MHPSEQVCAHTEGMSDGSPSPYLGNPLCSRQLRAQGTSNSKSRIAEPSV